MHNLRLHPDPLRQNLHLTRSLGDSNVPYQVRSTSQGHSSKALGTASQREACLRSSSRQQAREQSYCPRPGPLLLAGQSGGVMGLPRDFIVTCPLESDRSQPTRPSRWDSSLREKEDGRLGRASLWLLLCGQAPPRSPSWGMTHDSWRECP